MDSIDKIVACMKQAATIIDLDVPNTQAIRHVIGLSLDKAIETLYPLQSLQRQTAMVEAYREQYIKFNDHPSPFYPGIKKWLHCLKEQGYMLAVATGKGRNGLNRMLEKHGLQDLFSVTYCADETSSKPDPLMLNKIIEDLNVETHQALMIGDSSYDLKMANNANMDCIGVSYGVHSDKILSKYYPIAVLNDLPSELAAYI